MGQLLKYMGSRKANLGQPVCIFYSIKKLPENIKKKDSLKEEDLTVICVSKWVIFTIISLKGKKLKHGYMKYACVYMGGCMWCWLL